MPVNLWAATTAPPIHAGQTQVMIGGNRPEPGPEAARPSSLVPAKNDRPVHSCT